MEERILKKRSLAQLILFLAGGTWLWVIYVVFFLAPLVALMTFHYTQTKALLTEEVMERHRSIADLSSRVLSERFTHLQSVGVSLATRMQVRELVASGDWEGAAQMLSQVPENFPMIERMFLTDPSGTLLADYPARPNVRGMDFSYRDWYQGVSADWEPYVSNIYQRTAEPKLNVIAVAVPIRGATDEVIGIFVMQILLDTALEWSESVEFGESSVLYFVDSDGNVAGHPDFDPQGEIVNIADQTPVIAVLSGDADVLVLPETITAYQPIASFGWGAIMEQSIDEAFAARNADLERLLTTYLIFFVIVTGVSILFILAVREAARMAREQEIFLEAIGDGVFAIDTQWRVTLWNDAASQITGYTREEALGRSVRDVFQLIRTSDRKADFGFLDRAFTTKKAQAMTNHLLIVRKDGRDVPVRDSASPILDRSGRVQGVIVVFRDATVEKDLESLRLDFANASHQLRTPITKALWLLEGALEVASKKVKPNVQTAYMAIRSMVRFVDQIVDVSLIDQGRVVEQLKPTRVSTVLGRVEDDLRKQAKAHGVTFKMKKIPAVSVVTDARLFTLVLAELVGNAIRYNKPGGSVEVSVELQKESVIIRVTDTGIGIQASDEPYIFSKFFRGHNVDLEAEPGTGFGLYIAREYVRLLRGDVWFESKEGEGTTFFVRLPRKS